MGMNRFRPALVITMIRRVSLAFLVFGHSAFGGCCVHSRTGGTS